MSTCQLPHVGVHPVAPFRVTFADRSWVNACEDRALDHFSSAASTGTVIELITL